MGRVDGEAAGGILKNQAEIERVRSVLVGKLRDLLLFDLALSTGLPSTTLLSLKVRDLDGLKTGDRLEIARGGRERYPLDGRAAATFRRYRDRLRPDPDDYLFKSRKGDGPLSTASASRLVKSWFTKAGLEGLSGLLTLRRTAEATHNRGGDEPGGREPGGAAALKPVKVTTTQEMVYQSLERAIIAGTIRPGERLVADRLAGQLGVSRMPVRDAISRLEARSFITTQPGRGAVVNELSRENLMEILDLRLTLEIKAARRAAERTDSRTLAALEESQVQYIEARRRLDPDELLQANRYFHFTLYRLAGMPILESLIDQLWNRVSPYHHIMFRQTALDDPETGPSYHRLMIDAMARGDGNEVGRWLATDITEATEFVLEVVRHLKEFPA